MTEAPEEIWMDGLERRLRELDGEGMRGHVDSFTDYLEDALPLADEVPDPSGKEGVAVAGMGGSGIGGEILAGLCRDFSDVPVVPIHSPEPPAFVDEDYLFVTVSYSGNTEETLSAHREAVERGCEIVAMTSGGELERERAFDHLVELPGGMPPRSALPFQLVPLVELANGLGGGFDLEGAISEVEVSRQDAFKIAKGLEEAVPLIYGSGLFTPVAYRWKCQVNENAKRQAFHNYFPELDHNEVEGWGEDGFGCVVLRDGDSGMGERIEATKEAVLPEERTFEADFESDLSGLFSAILLGDWVSLYLAALNGVDPTPVDNIERVKDLMG